MSIRSSGVNGYKNRILSASLILWTATFPLFAVSLSFSAFQEAASFPFEIRNSSFNLPQALVMERRSTPHPLAFLLFISPGILILGCLPIGTGISTKDFPRFSSIFSRAIHDRSPPPPPLF